MCLAPDFALKRLTKFNITIGKVLLINFPFLFCECTSLITIDFPFRVNTQKKLSFVHTLMSTATLIFCQNLNQISL